MTSEANPTPAQRKYIGAVRGFLVGLVVIGVVAVLVYLARTFSDVADIPYLKFIAILLPLLIALCGIHNDKERTGPMQKKWIPLLYFGAGIVACVTLWSDGKALREARAEAHAWQAKAEQRQAEELTEIHRIGGMRGDAEMNGKYIEALQKVTRQYTGEKTQTAAVKLFNSLDERKRVRDEVSQANEKVRLATLLRTQPVCNFVVGKFDDWLNEIQKRGFKVVTTQDNTPSVSLKSPNWYMCRTVSFENGISARLQMLSASVEDGHVMGGVFMSIYFSSATKNDDPLLQVYIDEAAYGVRNLKPSRFPFKDYTGRISNPIEDSGLSTTLNDSVDQVMAFIAENAALDSQEKPH